MLKWAPGKLDSKTQKPYFYYSDCGQYYVGSPVNEAERSLTFYRPALRPGERERGASVLLGGFPTVQAARDAAENHAKEHAK
jgi:hypothetical protein